MNSKSSGPDRGLAVVTGASSGFGALFAERLAEQGRPLLLAGRNADRLREVHRHVERLHPSARISTVVGDLSTTQGVSDLKNALVGQDVEILINNAGFATYGHLVDADAAREREMVSVNVDALVQLTHAVLPGMIERKRGGILNVASLIGFQPAPLHATYAASKAFVLSFSQALWAETRGTGVTVTALCPGATATGFVDALHADVSTVSIYRNLAAPGPVVEAGLNGLASGKPVVIPGWRNRIMAEGGRLTPGWMSAKISARMLRSRS